jgi:uncharacterized membrane protein
MLAAASSSTGLVLTLPANYLYVGLVGIGTFWLNVFQASVVSNLRKTVRQSYRGSVLCYVLRLLTSYWFLPLKSGIKYPQYMAEESQCKDNKLAIQYNCAQRYVFS